MKKILLSLITLVTVFTVTGCTSDDHEKFDGEYVKVETRNENNQFVEVEFPKEPQRVVVLNYQTLDFMFANNLQHLIVGSVTSSMPKHLKEEFNKLEGVVELGGLKDYSLEKIMELQPHAIFSSDRSAAEYKTFTKIAPTYCGYIDYSKGFMNSYKKMANDHGKIFGIEDAVNETITSYDKRIEDIKLSHNNATSLLLLFTGNNINSLGDSSRCSIITNEMGFKNEYANENVNHGNQITFENVASVNPEYIFVLDKDAATGTQATPAEQLMDNVIIKGTNAYKENKIIYLTPGDAWYLCDGGISALDLMITCIEEGLGL